MFLQKIKTESLDLVLAVNRNSRMTYKLSSKATFLIPLIIILIASIPVMEGVMGNCLGFLVISPFDPGFCKTVALGIFMIPGITLLTIIDVKYALVRETLNNPIVAMISIYFVNYMFYLAIVALARYGINLKNHKKRHQTQK